jgi:hypothetical protein
MSVNIIDYEGPLGVNELRSAELQLGVQFPSDYRSFMLHYNGGRTQPGGFAISWADRQVVGEDWKTSTLSWLFFISDDPDENLLEMNLETFAGRIPQGTLAIARDAGGNLLLLALKGAYQGKLLFWVKDHEVEEGRSPGWENIGIVADSFEDFLNNKLR